MDAIVFDWDGTLFDSIGALFAANVEVMAALGLPFDEPTYRRAFAPDWREMYRNLGVPDERVDEANRLWLDAFDRHSEIGLLPGAEVALAAIAATGRPIGLVTAGHRAVVLPQLRRTGLDRHFAVTVFGDDLPVHKPDPAPLATALERLGVDDPRRAIYVGDTPADAWMTRAVGARAVGIASLLGDAGALLAAGVEEVQPSVAAWVSLRMPSGFAPPPPVRTR